MSLCSIEKYPNYNVNAFDNYCSFFYWCWRDFTSDCEPNFAFGITETQYRYFWSLIIAIPVLIEYLVAGFSLFPFGLCMYAYNTDMTECSFGLITGEDGDHLYIDAPVTINDTGTITSNDTSIEIAEQIEDHYSS